MLDKTEREIKIR